MEVKNLPNPSRTQNAKPLTSHDATVFEATFCCAGVGIAHMALDGTYIRVNPKFSAISGYSEVELLSFTFMQITHPDDVVGHLTGINTLLAGSLNNYEAEMRYLQKGGSVIWVNLSISLVRDVEGYPDYFVVVMQDISAQKSSAKHMLERQVAETRRMAREAELADEAKSRFLANISHELRTPIGIILGYADVLAGEQAFEGHAALLEPIKRNGRRLLAIVDDLIDSRHMEQENVELTCTRVDILPFIDQLVASLQKKAVEKNITLTWTSIRPLPTVIVTDADKLRQMLLKILENAIKFTDDGIVNLRLDCDLSGSAPLLRFEVTDSGIGIPFDRQKELFKPFFRVDSTFSRRHDGAGLGLNLARRLARLLGGDVTLTYSGAGVGSSFIATISIDHDATMPWTQTSSNFESNCVDIDSRRPKFEKIDLSGKRLLVAEDFEDNQDLICSMLSGSGVEVKVVENGKLALDAVLADRYDGILMDLQMPVMDGYCATAEIRKHGFIIPIIALTAHAMRSEEEKCMRGGFDFFLTKPIERMRLLKTIERFLKRDEKEINHNKVQPLLSTLDSDPMFANILVRFIEQLPAKVEKFSELLNQGNLDGIHKLAHQVKGAGAGYGFPTLSELAGRLEASTAIDAQMYDDLARLKFLCEQISAGVRNAPA